MDLEAVGVRSYISEPDRGRRRWKKNPEARDAVYRNRRSIRGARGLRLLRLRGERLERPFAHLYETGGMRHVHLRGHTNIRKRLLIPRRWLQSWAAHASADRLRHAARAARPPQCRACRTADANTTALGVRTASLVTGTRLLTTRPPLDCRRRHPAHQRERTGFHHGLLGARDGRGDSIAATSGSSSTCETRRSEDARRPAGPWAISRGGRKANRLADELCARGEARVLWR